MLLSIEVPDVDASSAVEGLGGTATSGANDMPWGQRVAHIKDPDGNVVNLTQSSDGSAHRPLRVSSASARAG